MKNLLMLGAIVAGTTFFASADTAKAEHCRYNGYRSSYGSRYYSPRSYSFGYYSSPRHYGSHHGYGNRYPRYNYGHHYGHRYGGSGFYVGGRNFSFGFHR